MGIHGLLKELGPGQRIALAKLSADHYVKHDRPLRLAIDISIWLFQVQSGKGGSNPALRTFYYRLLRLLSLDIHPLFVFDGPNKPLFKRNKKVGGPGVRVASVPEFLAKQLLKQFGFPWHVAPGEAEAECALLQREGIVDAVLSEDVDTLMFGSGVTVRNWSSENSTKSPTHVNVYRAEETKQKSGMDREGMILVALMSGGDYLPEGIPGCGPKLACDAARAGFGKELCVLSRRDAAGIQAWRERLQHQIRTNEDKAFRRKNTGFVIPEDFPNLEVLGFYTNPCVSAPDRLQRLRQELQWDQPIDFAALRCFTADAFDWRCLGGAKKFIRNLAPAMLVRELRLRGDVDNATEAQEQEMVQAIRAKRNHSTTDGELEYRIIFTPSSLVPIDLSIEEEDDQFIPAGGAAEESDAESDFMLFRSSTQDNESEVPASPSKKRTFKPYDPLQPEKLWILRTFLQLGCPLLVEEYEASFKDPREFLKARHKARAAAKGGSNIHAAAKTKKRATAKPGEGDEPVNALTNYAKVTKPRTEVERRALKEMTPTGNARSSKLDHASVDGAAVSLFKLPSTQIPDDLFRDKREKQDVEVLDLAESPQDPRRPFAAFARPRVAPALTQQRGQPLTPKRSKKRPSPDLSSPAASQRTITSYYSPSPRKPKASSQDEIIDLVSSSPVHKPLTPSPPNIRLNFVRSEASSPPPPPRRDFSPGKLPDTVTKRRKKGVLRRWQTAPAVLDEDGLSPTQSCSREMTLGAPEQGQRTVEALDLISSSPAHLPDHGEILRQEQTAHDVDATPIARRTLGIGAYSSPPASPGMESSESTTDHVFNRGDLLSASTTVHGKENSLLPTPPQTADSSLPRNHASGLEKQSTKIRQCPQARKPSASQPVRRSPRQQAIKKRIQLRESLEGWWKEVEAESVDLSGDGSGWKKSGGKAAIAKGFRKSGVEVLDLTGA